MALYHKSEPSRWLLHEHPNLQALHHGSPSSRWLEGFLRCASTCRREEALTFRLKPSKFSGESRPPQPNWIALAVVLLSLSTCESRTQHLGVFRSFVMEFRKVFDRTMQCIERPGDEITFLKRHHVLHPDGRLTIYTHHEHVLQLYSLLGLNAENQNKKSPAPADIDLEDKSENPPSSDATTFRTCVGILMEPLSPLRVLLVPSHVFHSAWRCLFSLLNFCFNVARHTADSIVMHKPSPFFN